ncbi:Ribosome recycling factor (Frr) [Fructobacillus fructosus]|uniref:ribosome recycling factor n=1 Tax=Fructobacillus fructosus TaxID=1631 RepID=UPI0002194383|nr:ribosome recycling factor [Fructobacillus fructosus]KRN53132.1 ribosome Recycling Factor, RRF [Fructobacillus fructosus KCTC 3544]MCK8638321.1 ribosome recycling factor [Fructobacillus fructosus]CAK1226698.1 Ribosome recycling factor (Frr) [Fructobacillus fructosus]CAK1226804.1 Ribosome recycling factor (Frr) [Fructobacillus fructosus]CAK1227026.1 Ribosome recycling factor (Frr) [Fructobacillus fructosus]
MAIDFNQATEKMKGAQDALRRELGEIRTGRANPRILDRVQVEYYGAMVPLNQVASISVPEARLLLITPFDKGALEAIVTAINVSDLGLNPASDGNIVRLAIPQMTEERRKELVKEVKAEAEKSKVAVRNVRRDAMDAIKKDKELTEDQVHESEDKVQKLTDDNIKAIDEIAEDKEKELMTI